jgi:DNA-binding MarR family transcriptional regulator
MLALIEHGKARKGAMPSNIFPSLDGIERRTGLPTSTVQRSLNALRDFGLIAWQTGRQGRSNRYALQTDSVAALDAAADRLLADADRAGPGEAHRIVRSLIELAGFRKAVEERRKAKATPADAAASWSQTTTQPVTGDHPTGHGRPVQLVMGDHLTRSLEQEPDTKNHTNNSDDDDSRRADDAPPPVVGVVGSFIEGKPDRPEAASEIDDDSQDAPRPREAPPERSDAEPPPATASDREALRGALRDLGVMGRTVEELIEHLAAIGGTAEHIRRAASKARLDEKTRNPTGVRISILRSLTATDIAAMREAERQSLRRELEKEERRKQEAIAKSLQPRYEIPLDDTGRDTRMLDYVATMRAGNEAYEAKRKNQAAARSDTPRHRPFLEALAEIRAAGGQGGNATHQESEAAA